MQLTLQIHHSGLWNSAAQFEVEEGHLKRGIRAASYFAYDSDYAFEWLNSKGIAALSCRFPVSFEQHSFNNWPAFLLDVLPNGAARRYLLSEWGLTDGPTSDVKLLKLGAGNPPGNIRVAEAAKKIFPANHIGFKREEVIEKNEEFIEYARSYGAPVAGSTGAAGDAPKWLLVQDNLDGNWHADAALEEHKIGMLWLVKFPRGKRESDKKVLRNEAAYMKAAKEFGVRVVAQPEYKPDALFVPRFDRKIENGKVIRYGLETLASLAGISEYGLRPNHELLVTALCQAVDNPEVELFEYLMRDVLNLALKNTDNHARNTSVLKCEDGSVALSPLYDFAPMFLDEDGIPRVTRWEGEKDGIPDWRQVLSVLDQYVSDGANLKDKFILLAPKIRTLPTLLEGANVDADLIRRLLPGIKKLADSVDALKR